MRRSLSRGLSLTLLSLSLSLPPALADEGMFTLTRPEDLPLRALKESGCELRGREISDKARSVVQVAGGGTGAFVSPDGLVITNHHVVYGCLATLNGQAEHDGILDRGILARSREQELACPGYFLTVPETNQEVTAQVRAASEGIADWHERYEAERRRKAELVAECERQPGRVCAIASMNGGLQEVLTASLRLLDLRLVYAPEKEIGKYGGDIDNWMYPRHTGDYAFLRAYVSPDGRPGQFDPANQPYHPSDWLRISTAGLKRDDFVMVLGYPGRTKRFESLFGAGFQAGTAVPQVLSLYGGMLTLLEPLAASAPAIDRAYAGLLAGLNNAHKYYDELRQGMERTGLLARKRQQQEGWLAALSQEERQVADGTLAEIERIYREYEAVFPTHFLLSRMAGVGSGALNTAFTIHRFAREKGKADGERKEERFKEKNRYRLYESSDLLEGRVALAGEVAIMAYYLRQAQKLAQPPACVKELLARTTARMEELETQARAARKELPDFFEGLYAQPLPDGLEERAALLLLLPTRLVVWTEDQAAREKAKALRRSWLDLEEAKLAPEVETDPLLRFAAALDQELLALEEGPLREVDERLSGELHRQWVAAIKAPYFDANSTLRLTFGKVKDYRSTATGKEYPALTTLSEALAKATGQWPFVIPEKLRAAAALPPGRWHDPRLNDVPVNFTATLDTTGGNSGSPVLDASGLLVGLLFDGTAESILSDWQYLEEDQRSICLDIRYALFIAEKVHEATELLDELGLTEMEDEE